MREECCAHFVLASRLLLAVLLPQGVLSLKLLRVGVPPYTERGEMALLQCLYELGNDSLYSVTWYKDDEEFYRYVPKANPTQHSYLLDGITVDRNMSDSQKVLLTNVNLQATGRYECEVSAEAPLFTSVKGEGRMEVFVLPDEGPRISGQDGIYQVGDVVSLNCTSGKSFPPSKLTWYINGSPVVPDYSAESNHHGLITSVVGLNFEVLPQHFFSGNMQIRCVANFAVNPQHGYRDRALPLEDNREVFLLIEGDANRSRCPAVILLMLTSLATWLVT